MKTSINSSNLFLFVFFLARFRFLESTTFELGDQVVAAVNCGGDKEIGAYGIVYDGDHSNAGSASNHGMQFAFINAHPKDVPIYQTERWSESSFEYNFDVKDDGYYVILLKFSEVYFRKPNEKVFDVSVNDVKVLENLDIFHVAGGIGQGYDVYIQVKIAGNDIHIDDYVQKYYGTLKIEFLKGAADNPKINAIAIISGKVEEMPPPPKPIINKDEDDDEDDSHAYNTHQNHHEQEYEESFEEYNAPPLSNTKEEEYNPFERELDFKYITVILIVVIFIPIYYLNRNQQV